MTARKASPPLAAGAVPWLLAAALATAAPHVFHLPLWLSLLVGGALLWRAWLWRAQAPLPARWRLALIVVLSVAAIAWEFRTLFGRDAGVALIVFFMAVKPLETRTRRDATAATRTSAACACTDLAIRRATSPGKRWHATSTSGRCWSRSSLAARRSSAGSIGR